MADPSIELRHAQEQIKRKKDAGVLREREDDRIFRHEAKVVRLEQDIAARDAEIRALQSRIKALTQAVEDANDDKDRATAETDSYVEQLSSLFAAARKDADKLRTQEINFTKHDRNLNQAREECNQLHRELQNLKDVRQEENSANLRHTAGLKQQLAEANRALKEAATSKLEASLREQALEEQLKSRTHELMRERAEAERLREENARLQKTVSDQQSLAAAARATENSGTALREELRIARSECVRIRDALAEATAAHALSEGQLRALHQQRREALEAQDNIERRERAERALAQQEQARLEASIHSLEGQLQQVIASRDLCQKGLEESLAARARLSEEARSRDAKIAEATGARVPVSTAQLCGEEADVFYAYVCIAECLAVREDLAKLNANRDSLLLDNERLQKEYKAAVTSSWETRELALEQRERKQQEQEQRHVLELEKLRSELRLKENRQAAEALAREEVAACVCEHTSVCVCVCVCVWDLYVYHYSLSLSLSLSLQYRLWTRSGASAGSAKMPPENIAWTKKTKPDSASSKPACSRSALWSPPPCRTLAVPVLPPAPCMPCPTPPPIILRLRPHKE
jgi:hypothetical protein